MADKLNWKAAREQAELIPDDINELPGSYWTELARCFTAALDLLREADNLLENTEDGPDWYRRRDVWIARVKEAIPDDDGWISDW